MINHPVHITDEGTISAFIPFCSFGDDADRVGKRLNNFQVPVCSLFREKVVAGQVCYEADINQFKQKLNWEEALKKGFGFLVDTNDEYDVKKQTRETSETMEKSSKSFDVYKHSENENTFRIMLKTISKYFYILH